MFIHSITCSACEIKQDYKTSIVSEELQKLCYHCGKGMKVLTSKILKFHNEPSSNLTDYEYNEEVQSCLGHSYRLGANHYYLSTYYHSYNYSWRKYLKENLNRYIQRA